jgi:hypothetical protein
MNLYQIFEGARVSLVGNKILPLFSGNVLILVAYLLVFREGLVCI